MKRHAFTPYVWRCPTRGFFFIRMDTGRKSHFLHSWHSGISMYETVFYEGSSRALAWREEIYAARILHALQERTAVMRANTEITALTKRFIDKALA